ncbi:cyclase family protein [Leucobacter sp. wl10]|nr:cyclase family protein [Leucobacter sp. wl10]
MTVYPGDPPVHVEPALTVERDGVAVVRLDFGSHTGTHVDAPAHTVVGGRTIDRIALDELSGEALILDVADRAGEVARIDAEALGIERLAPVPGIVMIRTGWDRYFGTERYLRHPYLCGEAARALVRLGMRVLGIDALNPDRTPRPGEEADFAVHEAVLGGDGAIVENLRGLERLAALGERVRVGVFPLPIAGGDGAPARVVAWEV